MAAGKHAVIVRAATELFLRQGYQATSTEQIAAAAAVSKQTVYTRFGDKESLFREVVLAVAPTAEAFAADLTASLTEVGAADEVEPVLRAVARRYLAAVMDPQVLALRRLVIGEAARFPEVAAAYHERSPATVLAALTRAFTRLAERGLLTVDDPGRAADDFAFLLLGRPLDHAMFHAATEVDIDATADHAVDVFLAGAPAHPQRSESRNAKNVAAQRSASSTCGPWPDSGNGSISTRPPAAR